MGVLDAPIRLALEPCKWLALAISVAYLGALVVIVPLTLPLAVKIGLGVASIIGYRGALRAHYFYAGGAITGILFDPVTGWQLQVGPDCWEEAELLSPALVLPWLTVLRFQFESGRRGSAILVAGWVDSAAFRRLRVRLKYPLDNEE